MNNLWLIIFFIISPLIFCQENSINLSDEEIEVINSLLQKINYEKNIVIINPELNYTFDKFENSTIENVGISLKRETGDEYPYLIDDFIIKNTGKIRINKNTNFIIPIQYSDDYYKINEEYFKKLREKEEQFERYRKEIILEFINNNIDRTSLLKKLEDKRMELGIIYIPRVEITFSRVGFNENRTKAILYYSYITIGGFGCGYYYILDKENNKWIIKSEIIKWIT
jgi:hypothetical protein